MSLLPSPFRKAPMFRGPFSHGSGIPKALVLDFCAQNDLYFVKAGPDLTYSYADGSEPLVVDGVMRGDPAYTNALPVGSEDVLAWSVGAGVTLDGDVYTIPTGKFVYTTVPLTNNVHNASIEAKALTGELTLRLYDNTTTYDQAINGVGRFNAIGLTVSSPSGLLIIRNDSGSDATVTLTNPQITVGPYLYPYILPGTTSVPRAGTAGGNGGSFNTSGDTAKSLALRQAFEGAPDGVELVTNGDCESAIPTMNTATIDVYNCTIGISEEQQSSGNSSLKLICSAGDFANIRFTDAVACGLTVGRLYRYSLSVYMPLTTVGGLFLGYKDNLGNIVIIYDYIVAGSKKPDLDQWVTITWDVVSDGEDRIFYLGLGSNSIAGDTLYLDDFSVNEISATPTIAALITIGDASTALTDGDLVNILTCNDTEDEFMGYGCDATGPYLWVSDGTNPIKVYVTWDRGSIIAFGLQTNEAGTQYQLWYQRYAADGVAIDSTIQTSSLETFAGTFNPSDAMRAYFLNDMPGGAMAFEVWNKVTTDAEKLEYIARYLP